MLFSLIFNRYTIGLSAVAMFAAPVIEFANVLLADVSATVATVAALPGLGQ